MSYGNDPGCNRHPHDGQLQASTNWREFTRRRLLWLYEDAARANGTTPQAQADLAAWRNLGRGRDAA